MHVLDQNYADLQKQLNDTKISLASAGVCPICSKMFKKLKTHFMPKGIFPRPLETRFVHGRKS